MRRCAEARFRVSRDRRSIVGATYIDFGKIEIFENPILFLYLNSVTWPLLYIAKEEQKDTLGALLYDFPGNTA